MVVLLSSFLALFLACATVGYAQYSHSEAEVANENLRKLATANNDLALNIHRELAAESSENIFFSPFSLSTAFAMLYYGTRGQTAEELRIALGYARARLEEELVHSTFRKYLTESLPSQDTSAYVFNLANAILVDTNLDIISSYKTEVEDIYQASVKDVNFMTEGPQIVHEINNWVREKTNGKIDTLLDDLDPATVLVLLNAVYFKGKWKTPFDPLFTTPIFFHNNGLLYNKTRVPMMYMVEELPYAEVYNLKALEMPYKGDNVSMVVLLPNDLDGLESLERSLTPRKLSNIRRQLFKTEVTLFIPKFKLEYSRELSREFQSVGARSIFTPGADFSGIATNGNIAVSEVLHKAVIEVNEEGSEAAAVTGMAVLREARYMPYFTVDRPFMFTIVDRRNDMILFLGRVTNL